MSLGCIQALEMHKNIVRATCKQWAGQLEDDLEAADIGWR